MEKNGSYGDFTLATKCPSIIGKNQTIVPSIVPSSTYKLRDCKHAAELSKPQQCYTDEEPFLYSRWGNPTNQAVAAHIAQLEKGFGTHLCGSGMGAISTTLLTYLKKGDHLITPNLIYGGSHVFIQEVLPEFGIEVTWLSDISIESYRKALKPNTKVIYAETPSNPTTSVIDLKGLAQLGAESKALTVVDGTFATPYHTKPIPLGIDISIHSGTKYLGGHSDLLCGVITTRTEEQWQLIWKNLRFFGSILSPFDAFLLERGIKTLPLRMEKHSANALQLATWLETHEKVSRVYYPGLTSHPQHEIAKQQMQHGFGGMLAFEVKGGIEAAQKLVESVKVITLAVSLGSVESLIEHPASMTHSEVPLAEREVIGITDGFIRFSVGIEDAADLIQDLENAFGKI